MSDNSMTQTTIDADEIARASYATAAAELHTIADALGDMSVPAGLAALVVELKISTKLYSRTPPADAVKIATVDAVALAVLGRAATTEAASSTQDWMYHKAEEQRGPVHVKVYELIADPKVHERDLEVERLRAELADANRKLAAATAAAVTPDSATLPEPRLGSQAALRAGGYR